MESFEPKKTALIRILQILQQYTDIDHPLKHEEIVEKLDSLYNITVERKVIGRNIAILNDVGYDIVTTKKGSYLAQRQFEDSELKLLIDGVLSSRYISANHSKELIGKLSSLSNKYFKSSIKNVYSVNEWGKSENQSLFYNIEIIDEAIQANKKIRFDYNKYGADKKLFTTSNQTTSPYLMILKNQHYFLIAIQERWQHIGHYRLDRITNISIVDEPRSDIRSIDGYENGIDYKRLSSSLPYMFTDKPQVVEFLTESWMIDQIVDWFGYDFSVEQKGDKYLIRVLVSLNAMEFWAMQYLKSVEIISPIELRDRIKTNLQNAMEKYNV